MAVSDATRRAAPLLRSALDDDDVKEQLTRAARSAAATLRARGKEPAPTLLQRAGSTISQSGQALVALGQSQEKPRRRGRKLLAVALAAGVVWAVARVASNETTEAADER